MAINFLDGITVDGDVGIGTTSPSHKLEVNGNTAIAAINGATTAGKPMLFVGESNAYGVGFRWDSGLSLDIVDFDNTTPTTTSGTKIGHFKIRDEEFYWKGNVGIGTTSPDSKLELIGDYKQKAADGNSQGFTLSINSSTDAVSLNNYYNASMIFSTNNSAKMTILGSGNVGIGTTSPGAKLHVRDQSQSISYMKMSAASNDANYGFFKFQDNTVNTGRLIIGTTYGYGVEKTGITVFNGNVGIGTTGTSEKLTVNGTIMSTDTSNPTLILQDTTHSDITIKGDSGIFSVSNQSVGQNITMLYNGTVGIGTTTPTQKLNVAGVIKIDTSSDKQMQFARTGGDTFSIEHDSSRMYFYNETSVNHTLTLLNGGNVGIGTTSPSNKLTVAGDIVTTAGQDGGMRMGGWPHNPTGYSFIGTTNMSGLEYCMLSDGTNTFVGAGTGGALRLRGPANDSSPQIEIDGSLCKVDTGDFKVEDGSIAVGNITNSTTNGRIDASNDVVAFSTSDIRLKDNIKNIDKALDKVNSIQGIEFDWIEKEEVHGNSGHDVGVIAQEIEKILPDVVTTRDNGYKAVKYEKIVPLLIEAIKDLSKQVDGLKRLI